MSVNDGTPTVTRGRLSAEGNSAVAFGSIPDETFAPLGSAQVPRPARTSRRRRCCGTGPGAGYDRAPAITSPAKPVPACHDNRRHRANRARSRASGKSL